MTEKAKWLDTALVIICVAVMVFLMAFIGLRAVGRQVLVKRYGMDNRFTDILFFDADELKTKKDQANEADAEEETTASELNWAKLYPFDESTLAEQRALEAATKKKWDPMRVWKYRVSKLKKGVQKYATNLLPGYYVLTEQAKRYEGFIRWNYVSYAEYNGVVSLSDGHLTSLMESVDTTASAQSFHRLQEFCEEKGVDLLYVQAPYKICRYDKESGTVDYSNQNADAFLAQLAEMGVATCDLREEIHRENLSHHDLFYRTDHHWKTETALWATQLIGETLNERYGYALDTSLLNEDLFVHEEYPNWFLGSAGKKVTLARTSPEDFTLLYPKYETSIHYKNPDASLDEVGDFSLMLEWDRLEPIDYYHKNPYAVYNYGDNALVEIENLNAQGEESILLIKDSFADPVISFLSMTTRYVQAIDLRVFTGSLERYIQENRPDAVVVLYEAGSFFNTVSLTSHKDTFDFR